VRTDFVCRLLEGKFPVSRLMGQAYGTGSITAGVSITIFKFTIDHLDARSYDLIIRKN
jgi:hypothetical protein